MKSFIKQWYKGKAEGRVETPLGNAVSFRRKYSLSAKIARSIAHFYLSHGKWILGFALALIVAIQRWN